MKRKLILFAAIILLLPSCARAEQPIQGKFVFYSLRDPKIGWAAYLLKDGKLNVLGKQMTSPVISPDGKTIAATIANGIVFLDENGNQKDLVVTDTTENLLRRPGKLAWSPDGNKILYSKPIPLKEERRWILNEYDLQTKIHKTLLDLGKGTNIGGMEFSPDGKQILAWVGDRNDIKMGTYILNSDGSDLRRLNKYGIAEAWYPDGKHIFYITNQDENGKQINDKFGAFFKMNIETGEVTKLRDLDMLILSSIQISKDGKYLYFSKSIPQEGRHIVLWDLNDPQKEIVVAKAVPLGGNAGLSQDLDPDWYQGD